MASFSMNASVLILQDRPFRINPSGFSFLRLTFKRANSIQPLA
jgi:hypothetical protein